VQRAVERKEREYLRANADAVALQARRFLSPQVRRIALKELAATSAFLGDARVRILGRDKSLIADSGDPGLPDEFLWVIPSGLAEIETERRGGAPFILPMPPRPGGMRHARPRDIIPFLRNLPLGTSHLYARRMSTPWGRRFIFEEEEGPPPDARSAHPTSRRLISATTAVGPASDPQGYVELSSPLSPSAEAISTVRSAVLFSGLGSLIVAVAFGLLVGRTISDPLRGLAATARRMADGDLSARAKGGRGDEIGEVARQFNAMAASLEGSFRDLRAERDALARFIADASHELRTPITALATFNELLLGSAADDPRAKSEFLRESGTQIARLRWITSNLLDLSRLDAGIASLVVGTHSAADILREAIGGFLAQAREKRISLSVAGVDPSLTVECDGNRMELAVANLVANAVKFSPEGSAVTVSARAADGNVEFIVSDNGPGIDAEDLPRIFARFFRGKNATDDGAGLGLSIVQSVARAHGGDVSVESAAGRGSTFTITVPRVPQKVPDPGAPPRLPPRP
jgi:signal transduction histidine kinase